jgi:perosamine synthetase
MIPYGRHSIDQADIDAVVRVLKGPSITQGPVVEEFEKAICSYVGAKYAVAVSSGTAALHIAMIASGILPQESMVTSPITFVATSNAALYVGSSVLFVDVDAETINISPELLQQTLNKSDKVKVIIPVHFAGLSCEMDRIQTIANKHGAIIIEDASHALGGSYSDGRKIGCSQHSSMTVFSFHPVKAIAAGEGGMITTNDETVYRKLLRLRSHGINKLDDPYLIPEQSATEGVRDPWYYEMQELGYNYRITEFQCALALSQLSKLDKALERKKVLADKYERAFHDHKFIRPAQPRIGSQSGDHLYVVRIDFKSLGFSKAFFMQELIKRKIVTQVHYIPVPAHPFYRKLGFKPEDYPAALHYYEEALSIPFYPSLTDAEQEHVISSICKLLS